MADPRYSHPDFGTREEDWPDPDIDSNTEEARESIRLAEAAHLATIDRSIARRNQQPTYPAIPQALYVKAQVHQDQLTDEERRLLLSRGDLVGKVLASPDSLTNDEIHDFLQWPPPSVVRANIQRATGGALSTPTELYAKAKDAIDRGQLETMLSEDEICLPPRQFHAMDSTTYNTGAVMAAYHVPGRTQAVSLLHRRLGLDVVVLQDCAVYVVEQRRRKWSRDITLDPRPVDETIIFINSLIKHHEQGLISDQEAIARNWEYLEALQAAVIRGPIPSAPLEQIIGSIESLREQHLLGNITDQEAMIRTAKYLASFRAASGRSAPAPSESDRFGSGPWPPTSVPQTPIGVFASTTNLSGGNVVPAWLDLSEDQREAYRGQYETVRRAAWATHETEQAERAAHASPPNREQNQQLRYPDNLADPRAPRERRPGLMLRPTTITGLKVFRDEIGLEVEIQEALARWDALTDEQKAVYTARAKVLDDAAKAAYQASRRNYFNTHH